MTMPIKTQCPHCHACFDIQQTQLDRRNAAVCCDNCQQNFLVNKHLIVTNDSTSKQQSAVTSDTLIHDDMIHDDMDTNESPETNLEYDSLDGMDAWLDHVTDESSIPRDKQTSTAPLQTNNDHSATTKTAISSTAANNIHANIDETSDNSWLEQLLEEQNENENGTQTDTDLSQLLLNMGVPLKDDSKVDQARASDIQSTPKRDRPSIAVMLWAKGCLILALLLFAQYVIFNLDTLIKNPAYAQRLQAVCSITVCSLPSADLSALTMTNLNHRPSQVNTTAGFSDVQAVLNNQSMQAQLLPSLKVSVYGSNVLIGEFIAAPDEYLTSIQNQLVAEGRKQLMFTIPVANDQISKVTIDPIY